MRSEVSVIINVLILRYLSLIRRSKILIILINNYFISDFDFVFY